MKFKLKRELLFDLGVVILFLASLLWVFLYPLKQELSVEMYYRHADEGIKARLFWGENGELSADRCSDGVRTNNTVLFPLPQSPQELYMLRINPSNTAAQYSVSRISLLLNKEYFLAMDGNEILQRFVPVNATAALSEEDDHVLILTPLTEDSGLLISDDGLHRAALEASASLRQRQLRQRFCTMLLLALCLFAAIHFAPALGKYLKRLFTKDVDGRFDWFTFFATAVMAGALLVVTVIGLGSELGLHPDEWDVKACLDYGMTHFLPPDMRDTDVSGTYSGYGYTKLNNYTWYFYLAGKVSLLFQYLFFSLPYYRIPNILLFAALAFLFARNIRKKKWMMAALGICAQAWYIFSYTTADALDFFLAFLVIWQLSDDNSLLYRTVEENKITRRSLPGFLALGFLFGMVGLGKPNYLATLALAFFVLLFRLIRRKDKSGKRLLLRNYSFIVGLFCVMLLFRAGFDLLHYGLDKKEISQTMAIAYAHPDKNPATPLEEQSPSYHMFSKGATLSDFFDENPEWLFMSYKSFCGLIQDNDTGMWYYIIMGILYTAVFVCMAVYVFRKNGNFWGRVEFITVAVLMAGSLVASIVNSYVIDSQAQGRYLLPVILAAGYLASRVPELFEKRFFKALLVAAGILSVGYFGLVGVPTFL